MELTNYGGEDISRNVTAAKGSYHIENNQYQKENFAEAFCCTMFDSTGIYNMHEQAPRLQEAIIELCDKIWKGRNETVRERVYKNIKFIEGLVGDDKNKEGIIKALSKL